MVYTLASQSGHPSWLDLFIQFFFFLAQEHKASQCYKWRQKKFSHFQRDLLPWVFMWAQQPTEHLAHQVKEVLLSPCVFSTPTRTGNKSARPPQDWPRENPQHPKLNEWRNIRKLTHCFLWGLKNDIISVREDYILIKSWFLIFKGENTYSETNSELSFEGCSRKRIGC